MNIEKLHKKLIKKNITLSMAESCTGGLLSINKSLINLKGKTVEKLGIIGKEQAIACEVICSLSR